MEVKLRKNFYDTLIPKVSSDSLRVKVEFDYKGPAQTLDFETNTGKRGLWGDYDQESPTYHDSKYVSKSDTFRSYTFTRYIPLSFWGSRQIDDGAVEVVIRGEGVYDDAVLWDAYTVNIPGEYTLTLQQSPAVGWITIEPDKPKYSYGDFIKLTSYMDSWAIGSYAFNYWEKDGEWLDTRNPVNTIVTGNNVFVARYRTL